VKTPKKLAIKDDMRAEYKRSDFGVMERGKYADFARKALIVEKAQSDIETPFPQSQLEQDVIVDTRARMTEKQLRELRAKLGNAPVNLR
jgi:hypothetical protein